MICSLKHHLTLKKEAYLEGIGIHSGKLCSVKLKPSKEIGILFKLNRNNSSIIFKVTPEIVLDTRNQIMIGFKNYQIMLIEHLLSAFNGLGITNCIVETDSIEIPGMDGSSYNLVEAILDAGIDELSSTYEPISLPYPIWEVNEDAHFIVLPSEEELSINCSISYPYPSIGIQTFYSKITPDIYINEISKARTFGFIEDHEKLKKRGVCLGSSFDNTLALSKEKVLSPELRYENEVIRHKALDIIGELYLLNTPIKGNIIANKSNHTMDFKAIYKIFSILKNQKPSKEEIKEQYKKFDFIVSKRIKKL